MVISNAVVNPHAVLSALSDIERRAVQSNMSGKRQFIRKSLRGEAVLQTLEDASIDAENIRVQLRDVSLAGLGFLTGQPLETGTIWRVLFVSRNYVVGQQTIVVRHCRKIMEGAYLCGGQFSMDPGLLHTLDIDPKSLRDSDNDQFVDSSHLSGDGAAE